MDQKEYPVLYAGKMSFLNLGGVDIGALESHSGSIGFLRGIKVHRSIYHCHYALSEDLKRVDAMMVVSHDYEGDTLIANEPIGSFYVGLSGIVGFFSSPKKEYTMKQLGEYLAQLDKEHTGRAWHVLNSKQFMAPCSQGPATKVIVYAHRDRYGDVDALQIEFNRKEGELLSKGGEIADGEK